MNYKHYNNKPTTIPRNLANILATAAFLKGIYFKGSSLFTCLFL